MLIITKTKIDIKRASNARLNKITLTAHDIKKSLKANVNLYRHTISVSNRRFKNAGPRSLNAKSMPVKSIDK